jgi:imidazole glycerol phosphate synthase glutamine amidotransferase subunit
MSQRDVVIVQTGTANLASVLAGLRRAGASPRVAESRQDVEQARLLVLPGVGAFGASMARLEQDGTADVLRARVEAGRPLLAICVGLQLLCRSSEESPGVQGLGVVAADVARFNGDVRVPHLGWNAVVPDEGFDAAEGGFAYFANSYRVTEAPAGWKLAWSDHGGKFAAALQRGAVLACQFHPELSGAWGTNLLRRWIGGSEAAC